MASGGYDRVARREYWILLKNIEDFISWTDVEGEGGSTRRVQYYWTRAGCGFRISQSGWTPPAWVAWTRRLRLASLV